jgi:hypothetical protein
MLHFAWMGGHSHTPVKLTGADIDVTGANAGDPAADLKTLDLANIAAFADTTKATLLDPTVQHAASRVAARVRLRGGKLYAIGSVGSPQVAWSISTESLKDDHGYVPSDLTQGVIWDSGAAQVNLSLSIGATTTSFTVQGEHGAGHATMGITNLPWPDFPNPAATHTRRPRYAGERIYDDDFKWLFRLFDPVGSWGSLVDVNPMKQLPVPVRYYVQPDPTPFKIMIPSTGDCIGGTYF